jgi:hypothetical protein
VSPFYTCCGIQFPYELGKYGCPNCNGDKVAKLKDHHMPTTCRVHYFRDENDDRTVVETTLMTTGRYRADLIETPGGALELLKLVGYGASRIGAIADLQQKIEAEGQSCSTD